MNGGNIRLRMTLKINVRCLYLASEMNGDNIPLRMTLKINVVCLSLVSEMNGGNIRLRITLKINSDFAVLVYKANPRLLLSSDGKKIAPYIRDFSVI